MQHPKARRFSRRGGPCLKGPSCSIHIALTCAAIPQRAVAEAKETPGGLAALRPVRRQGLASHFEREFCKKLYGISQQRLPPPLECILRRQRGAVAPTGGSERDRRDGRPRMRAAPSANPSRRCQRGVRMCVTGALPVRGPHGSAPLPVGRPWVWRAACHDAASAVARLPVALAFGVVFQACSSKAERCYHMAEVGGSIPSAPTSMARPGAWRGRRAPAAALGRFLRPAGRTLCSE